MTKGESIREIQEADRLNPREEEEQAGERGRIRGHLHLQETAEIKEKEIRNTIIRGRVAHSREEGVIT